MFGMWIITVGCCAGGFVRLLSIQLLFVYPITAFKPAEANPEIAENAIVFRFGT